MVGAKRVAGLAIKFHQGASDMCYWYLQILIHTVTEGSSHLLPTFRKKYNSMFNKAAEFFTLKTTFMEILGLNLHKTCLLACVAWKI